MDHSQEVMADGRLWNSEAGQGRECEGLRRGLQEDAEGQELPLQSVKESMVGSYF